MSDIKKFKPDELMIQGKDNDGNTVERIYLKSIEYTIYRTKNSLRLDISDDSNELETYMQNHYKLGVDLARIYSWLPENLSWSEPINRQIARAMAVNIAGNHEDAKIMLDHAENRIIKLKTIQGRLQYTMSSFALVGMIFLLLLFFDISEINNYSWYTKIALCGSLGGVLSVATSYSSLNIDIDANAITNCMIGSSRILISVSAALFSLFAVKSEIAFSFIGKLPTNERLYLIAMVAGFSERLIPSIMNNLSQKNGPLKSE